MTLSVQLGVGLAILTALVSSIGFLYKQRGAVEAPLVDWRRPVHSSVVLFRSKWYVVGILVAMGSWGLHVAALALAPITLVQTVIAGGLVFVAVAADRLFGFRVSGREWAGVALAAVGLAFLAATFEGGSGAESDYDTAVLAAFAVGIVALGAIFLLVARGPRAPLWVAASAGLLWGASDVSIKALSDHLGDLGPLVIVHPLALVILALSLLGLLVSARSLQTGAAVPVIALTSVAANVSTIAAGPIVFGEELPADPAALAARLGAFALVVLAAALIPGPLRAAEAGSG